MWDLNFDLTNIFSDQLSLLTEHPEPVVDGDDHEVAVGGHHGAVIQVAASPVEAVAMNEENNWTRGVLEIT